MNLDYHLNLAKFLFQQPEGNGHNLNTTKGFHQ